MRRMYTHDDPLDAPSDAEEQALLVGSLLHATFLDTSSGLKLPRFSGCLRMLFACADLYGSGTCEAALHAGG